MNNTFASNGFRQACASFALISSLAFSSSALAWGAGGHMIVAYIAHERLNAHARSEADRLLVVPLEPANVWQKTQDFVSASLWADDVKRLHEYAFSAPMHFIDYPFSPDRTPLPDLPAPINIVTALDQYVSELKTGTDDVERAKALRFIIHFVGDIHQPLHCASRVTQARPEGDKGGNDFMIVETDAAGHRSTVKLHSYWDGGIQSFPRMGAHFAPPPLDEIPPAALQATAANPDLDTGWQPGGVFGFTEWSKESEALARSVVYTGLRENRLPSQAYVARSQKLVGQRVAWAGYRLAALLNGIWP